MAYKIEYGGYADRGFVSIISGIGVSNIQAGDNFDLSFPNFSGSYEVHIAKEAINDGFIYWQNVQALTKVNGRYQVPANFKTDPNYFFRIQCSGMTIGNAINFIIETDNLKIAKAFLSPKATMLSPTISRKCDTIETEHNYICANIIGNTEATYDHYITTGGKDKGTNLMWYKTNNPEYFSTICYIKNLGEQDLVMTYCIQGHVVKKDGSEIWRHPAIEDDGLDNGYGYKTITIKRGETKLLEYCVRIRKTETKNSYHKYYCYISTSTTTQTGSTYFDVDNLFWRFDIGPDNEKVEVSHFIILNEKLRNKGDLANSVQDNAAIELTVIDQQTLK